MKTWTVTFEQRVEHLEYYSSEVIAETEEEAVAIVQKLHSDGGLSPDMSEWTETLDILDDEDFIAEEN